MLSERLTPAWYIVRSENTAARWFNTLHWPYLIFHLSYVPIGTALASSVSYVVFGWLVVAFFLGMGLGSHCFDLVKGDPLRLGFKPEHLKACGASSLILAALIGYLLFAYGYVDAWFLLAVPLGVLFSVGYGMEWPGLHGDWQFAAWWAVFPFLVSYFAQGIEWSWALIPIGAFVYATAVVQRRLSTQARFVRRTMKDMVGFYLDRDSVRSEITKEWIINPAERSLAALSFAMPMLAAGLMLWRQ